MAERYGVETRRSGLERHRALSHERPKKASFRRLRAWRPERPAPRARAPPPPRSPSALASPPPEGARAPLSTAAHTAPRPAPPAGTHTSRYQALSCLSARLARARAAPRDLQRPRLTPSSGARVPSLLRSPYPDPGHSCTCTRAACTPAAIRPFPNAARAAAPSHPALHPQLTTPSRARAPLVAGLRGPCRHVRPSHRPKVWRSCRSRSKLSQLRWRRPLVSEMRTPTS